MKKMKWMMMALLVGAMNLYALPPEIRFDMLKTKLAPQLEAAEYSDVLETLTEMRAMGIPLPDSMDFFEGKALFESGQQGASYPKFESYVTAVGKEGNFYGDAIAYLVKAEGAHKEALELKQMMAGQGSSPEVGEKWMVAVPGGMEFMPIAAGSFQMGSNDGDSDERPVHRVTLSKPFWLAKTEVTQAQYEAIMGSNPSHFKGSENPVEEVSWHDAVSFCKKLTEREQKAGRLPADYVYRLPTEAQWEYACRAGTTGDYAGTLGAMGWYESNSGGKTHSVGQKQANAWGLYDMHGNVWEWCSDWKGDYPSGSVNDPGGASSGSYRVRRGGGWYYGAADCRSANRSSHEPSRAYNNLGFRPLVQQR